MPLLDHFSWIAPHYDRMAGVRDISKLADVFGLPAPGILLDAGGGTGRISHALNGLIPCRVVVDVAPGMLRQARAKPGVEVAGAESEHLPFADNTFDRIIMVDALHHVADATLTTSELFRVLKPGGRLVIEEPDIRRFGVKLVALGEKLLFMRSHFVAPPVIAEMLRYPNTKIKIDTEAYIAWVIVEKG
jgi:ubiquinone/menaquinone biosynthesis C-methylase UbiE